MEVPHVKIKEENIGDYSDSGRQLSDEETDEKGPRHVDEDDETDPVVFYFESDQLALKANKEYHDLLKTLFTLEAQRESAMKAIDKINGLLKEVENDPIEFIAKIKRGESVGLPEKHIIPEIPHIEWSRYNLPAPPEPYLPQSKTKLSNKTESMLSSSLQQESSCNNSDKRSKILVRGRAFDDSKPETFNQLWTSEEQRRLEELLLEYPPEDVETRRWEKIADALGNRTAKQVQSRVQKYFIKLQKAGLPIPGRCPRLQNESSWRKAYHKHQRNNHLLYKPSTFFPSNDVPMSMSDSDEDVSLPKKALSSNDYPMHDNINRDASSDQESVVPPGKEKCSREYMKLEMLKKVEREIEKTNGSPKFQHIGFQCEFCQEEPIIGTRWHCDECMSHGESIDYCSDCVITLLDETENPFSSINPKLQNTQKNPHPLEHNLHPIRGHSGKTTTGVWDKEYLTDSFYGGYNYLDPNFMPD